MKFYFSVIFFCCFFVAQSQDTSLLNEIEDKQKVVAQKVYGTFKSTRVINAHSVDMLAKGNLDFRILHRFGNVDAGVKQFFGLDQASMRMSFDYGICNNFTVGVGRSTLRKEIDIFTKFRVIQQSKGDKDLPLSLVIAAGFMVWTEESFATDKPNFSDRSSNYIQILAGRKFTNKFSLQISPIWLHSNLPLSGHEKNLFAIGGGARYKFSKRMALTADYHHLLNGLTPANTNPFSVGVDIETGGHVFQLHFSNAAGMNERAFISETYNKFFKGQIRFGFNLSRMFQIGSRD